MAEARELAGRGDWPALWQLVPHLRLADAVRAVGLFGDAWRPPDGNGQQLFGQLAAADPGVSESLTGPVRRFRRRGGRVGYGVDIRADRQEIVAHEASLPGPGAIRVYDVASGHVVRRWRARWPRWRLVHLGDAVVSVEEKNCRQWQGQIVRYSRPRGREVLFTDPGEAGRPRIARVHDGFVAATYRRLFRGEADGPLREVPLPRLLLPGDRWIIDHLDADTPSGRIAVAIANFATREYRVVVLDDELMVTGSTQDGDDVHLEGIHSLQFCGPGTLISHADYGKLRSWQVGQPVTLQGQADFLYNPPVKRDEFGDILKPIPPRFFLWPVPSLGQVVVGGRRETIGDYPVSDGAVLDARSLTRVSSPPWLRYSCQQTQDMAADGDYIAWWNRNRVEVYDLRLSALHRLASEPLDQARPADVELLEAAGARMLPPAAERAVNLLRACLQYRFES